MGYARTLTRGAWRFGVVLPALLALLLVLVCAASAHAAEPPVLGSLSITPATINTSSSSETVTATAEITSASGLVSASIAFQSPTGNQTTTRVAFTRASGSETKGTYEAKVPFKQYSAAGTWRVTTVDLADKEGNQLHLSSTQLAGKVFAHAVTVEGTEDNAPPVVVGLSILPSTINTTSSSQVVTVTAHITDNLSGFASGYVQLKSSTGKHTTARVTLTKVSGTGTDGVYEAKVTFKRYTQLGTWLVNALNVVDNVGNEATLSSTRLQAKGLPDSIQVEGTEDSEPPSLAGLSISPSTVNTTSSSQVVTVTAHITDNLSGVASGSIVFSSPSGKEVTTEAAFTKASGTETDGSYEAKVTFERHVQSGSWTVGDLQLVDNVGNEVNLVSSQLEGKGLPHAVQVESEEDSEPPAVATLSIAPSTVNTTASGETVTVTAEITDNLSGFANGSIVFESPNGKATTSRVLFTKISGTSAKGTYEAQVPFNRYIQAGTWKVSDLRLADRAANEVDLTAAQLEGKSLPATVHVESTEDIEPPALAGLAIAPAMIDTASSSQLVTVSAHITDDLSGFTHGYVVFESQNGKHLTDRAVFAKASGTETDGTYEGVVTFPQTLESGTWKVNELNLVDRAGNETTLAAAQLVAKGLPYTVNDETGARPVVVKLSPKKGPSGGMTPVTITGMNFTGATAVSFGSTSALSVHVISVSTIEVTSPPGTSGTVDVTVTTPNGTSGLSKHDRYQYLAPTVTSVSPSSGPRTSETSVTITGTGFALGEVTKFKFGKFGAVSSNCTSTTSCTAVSPPALRAGTVDVIATIAAKHSARGSADRFTYT